MSKVIKEIIIMLLICLVVMLLFAVIFYEYIPNRKIVPEVVQYQATEEVKQQLADDIDQDNDDKIVLTYEVTSSDLYNYEVTNDYVPGKAAPFAVIVDEPEETEETDNTTNSTNGSSTTTDTTKTSSSKTSTNTNTSTGTTSNTSSGSSYLGNDVIK